MMSERLIKVNDIDKSLNKIQSDIESDFEFNNIDGNYKRYISIMADDTLSLNRAYKVISHLSIRSKFITLIPISYKECDFDCITISDIFRSVKNSDSFNVNCISILNGYKIPSGNFIISISIENGYNNLTKSYTFSQ